MILDQVLEINETGTDRQRNIKETKENKKLGGKNVSPADSSLGFRRNNLAQHIAKTLAMTRAVLTGSLFTAAVYAARILGTQSDADAGKSYFSPLLGTHCQHSIPGASIHPPAAEPLYQHPCEKPPDEVNNAQEYFPVGGTAT